MLHMDAYRRMHTNRKGEHGELVKEVETEGINYAQGEREDTTNNFKRLEGRRFYCKQIVRIVFLKVLIKLEAQGYPFLQGKPSGRLQNCMPICRV